MLQILDRRAEGDGRLLLHKPAARWTVERDGPAASEEASRRRGVVRRGRGGAWEPESTRASSEIRTLLVSGSAVSRVRRVARSYDRRRGRRRRDAAHALRRIVSRAR